MKPRAHGFSLMEMLVTLMLVSFATMLMFQMLGSYRVARERVQAQAAGIDRQALFQAWLRASVHGLFAGPDLRFTGDARRFGGVSLNPLYAPQGSPSRVAWAIRDGGEGGTEIVYEEGGEERWALAVDGTDVQFAYLDEAGKETATWPPAHGLVKPEALPAMVVFRRQLAGREHPVVAAVLGPLEPPTRLYGDEELE